MDIFLKHQLRIARNTLKLSEVGASILGGMTIPEAIFLLHRNGWSIFKLITTLQEQGHSTQDIDRLITESKL
jgi:hypothetical protein